MMMFLPLTKLNQEVINILIQILDSDLQVCLLKGLTTLKEKFLVHIGQKNMKQKVNLAYKKIVHSSQYRTQSYPGCRDECPELESKSTWIGTVQISSR